MLKFTAIGDFHYKKGVFPTSLEDLDKILKNSFEENVDFVLHLGDLCNDYKGSPELLSALLNNKYNLPVYGIMGNHEIEPENHPDTVIPLLCNRKVTFAEPIYNENKAAHWHKDIGNFRLIGLDTNFVYSPERDEWERKMSFWKPEGTILDLSLSPLQLEWLDKIIKEAASLGKKVVVASHASLINDPWICESPDFEEAQAIFAKYPKTVLVAINGHIHDDNFAVRDNVAYFDVNAARFGYWFKKDEHHYLEEHTFPFTNYDKDGNKLDTVDRSYRSIAQGMHGWFYKEPLWAIVSLSEDGHISIKGRKTEWEYGIAPNQSSNLAPDIERFKPEILDRDVHIW